MVIRLKKNKVLIIPEFTQFGGAKTYFKELLRYYAERQFEVVICCGVENQNEDVIKVIRDFGMSCRTIKERPHVIKDIWNKPPFSFIMDIILLFKTCLEFKPDFIVVSNINPVSFLGLSLFPKPFIGIIHTYPYDKPKNFTQRIRFSVTNFILNRIFSLPSKRLIAVSEYSKKLIIHSLNIPSDAVSVIHNCGGRLGSVPNHEANNDHVVVLTFGHVVFYKNPFMWIKVAEKVINSIQDKNIQFIWGGDGELLGQCHRGRSLSKS